MPNTYLTLASPGQAEHTIKKSRFVGHAAQVCTPDEAMAFLQQIKLAHPGANHHAWGYSLHDGKQRYHDDGEPQGTAGLPMLDVLKKQNIVDAIVVVTRYFGGIHLGAGGLVRAYSQTAALAVQAAGIALIELCSVIRIGVDYNLYGRVQNAITGCMVLDTQFGQEVLLDVRVRTSETPGFIAGVIDACNGSVICEIMREEFSEIACKS